MSSWLRVARGLQKVVGAASSNLSESATTDASRIIQHAAELSSRLATSTGQGENSRSFEGFHQSTMGTTESHVMSARTDSTDHRSRQSPEAFNSDQGTITISDQSVPTPLIVEKEYVNQNTVLDSTDRKTLPKSQSTPSISPENTIRQASPIPQIDMNETDKTSDSNDTITHFEENRMQEGAPVPSTRWGRALGFANLGLGLAYGAVGEGARRLFAPTTGSQQPDTSKSGRSSIVMNDANADRLAATLCRMRGAALKLGQMLSIQDASLLPPPLTRALAQVRQGAAAMPTSQLNDQMVAQYGKKWRDRFVSFDPVPCAAASIGQVHRAVIRTNDGQKQSVVVKVQYPGVAESISSDLRNLSMIVKWSGVMPKGLFIENVMRVGEQELRVECDYQRERKNQQRMQQLVHGDPMLYDHHKFRVPDVYDDWCTDQVLVTSFAPGGTVDRIAETASQEERNRLGKGIIDLTMKELFTWRFMQTDPNWGNFLYDIGTGTTNLIDFGAAREFSKSFVDGYLRIVWASANRDRETLLAQSHKMQFLTGQENDQMIRAHTLSGFTVGEPFANDDPFDFRGSRISERMGEHTSVFLRHRLTPPPEEVYTLHRKLAGAYMLCIRLGSVFSARELLSNLVENHSFEDGLPHPMEKANH